MCPIKRNLSQTPVNPQDIEEFAVLTRALGHPHRLAILRCLRERNTCICGEIVDVLPVAQSTVSQHLKKLKDAGWIKGEIEGPRSCYCVNEQTLKRFLELADKLLDKSAFRCCGMTIERKSHE